MRFVSLIIAFLLLSALASVAKTQSGREGDSEALGGDKLELESRLRYATTRLEGAQAENEGLKELIGHLRNDIAGKVIEISTLNEQFSNLKALHEETTEEGTRLKKLVDELQSDLASQVIAGGGLREEFERLTTQFRYQEGENTRLNDLLAEVKKALEKKESTLNRVLMKLALVKTQFAQLQAHLNKSRQALDNMALRYEEEALAKAALDKALEVSQTENTRLHQELFAVTKRMNTLRGKVSTLNDEIEGLYARIEGLRKEQTRQEKTWGAERSALEGQLAEREAQTLSLTNQRSGLLLLLLGAVIGGFILWRRDVSHRRESA